MTTPLHPIDGGPARRASDPDDPDFEATCLCCGRRTDDLDDDWLCEDCHEYKDELDYSEHEGPELFREGEEGGARGR